MLLNEQKFVLDSVPLQILMIDGKVEHTYKIIKDAISMVQLYFKKPIIGPKTEVKIVSKVADTQTCDDLHFEQIKLEIKKQRRYFQNKKAATFNSMMTSLDESNELVTFIEAITTPPKPPTPPPVQE
jgi:adenylate cyclase class IV